MSVLDISNETILVIILSSVLSAILSQYVPNKNEINKHPFKNILLVSLVGIVLLFIMLLCLWGLEVVSVLINYLFN